MNEKNENTIETTPEFWTQDPVVLFKQWWNIFPNANTMTMNETLNALTRLILLLTGVTFFYETNIRILVVGALSISAVVIFYFVQRKKHWEMFSQQKDEQVKQLNNQDDAEIFDVPSVNNPLSNVLVSDYEYNVDKKPAPPVDNPEVKDAILSTAKQTAAAMNPDIADKLFKNMGDDFTFEQSMRAFYTQPGSTIPNDQEAFTKFCYGSMISCKEGNAFACARNAPRHMT